MSGKSILITGGSSFLGALTARRILRLAPDEKTVMTDIAHHARTASLAGKVAFVLADLSGSSDMSRPADPRHRRRVPHRLAEGSGARSCGRLQRQCARQREPPGSLPGKRDVPRFFLAGSIATCGGERLAKIVDDSSHQHPQNSYGVANEYLQDVSANA
jgi:nucleoside-diphosphate-sugar epimerase